MIKRNDIVIFAAILLAAALCFAVIKLTHSGTGKRVIIRQNNEIVYEGALGTDKTLRLEGNTVEIKSGKVRIISADCKNQICVNHTAVSKSGESIICLPNKLSAEVE